MRRFGALKSDRSVIYIAQHFNDHYQIYGLNSDSGEPTMQVQFTDSYPSGEVYSVEEANDRLFIVHSLTNRALTVLNITTQQVMYISAIDDSSEDITNMLALTSGSIYLFGSTPLNTNAYIFKAFYSGVTDRISETFSTISGDYEIVDSTEGSMTHSITDLVYNSSPTDTAYTLYFIPSISKYTSVWNLDHYEVDVPQNSVIELDFIWT